MEKLITLTMEKETKGTYRYKEDGDADQYVIGTLYIRKSAFTERPIPQKLSVTIKGE